MDGDSGGKVGDASSPTDATPHMTMPFRAAYRVRVALPARIR